MGKNVRRTLKIANIDTNKLSKSSGRCPNCCTLIFSYFLHFINRTILHFAQISDFFIKKCIISATEKHALFFIYLLFLFSILSR